MDTRKPDFTLAVSTEIPRGLSPYRLRNGDGVELEEVNKFLDAQATRGLSVRTLRAYGYSLLNFWKWWTKTQKALSDLEESDLEVYIRFQRQTTARNKLETAPKTINHRLTVVRCLYRFHFGREVPGRSRYRRHSHPLANTVASPSGYLYPARAVTAGLFVKTPRRIVEPLTPEEVRTFIGHLRTRRDVSIVALMLLDGMRSREVLELTLDDLSLADGHVRVHGKGDKERLLPLAPQLIPLIRSYLEVERPSSSYPQLFLCLKGHKRGQPMTATGLRSLFRHHRVFANVAKANAHRFRHTFGADMVRGGMTLPMLKELMGHSDIHTTMLYVELSPEDIWREFHRVVRGMTIPKPDEP